MPPSESRARTFTETARRAQIIAAAIDTVNAIGFHRASLAEIATRARVAKSAIVYYFSSRDALMLSVVEEVFSRVETAVAAAEVVEGGPAARLGAYARAYLSYVDGHRAEVTAGVEIVVSHRVEDGTPLYLLRDPDDSSLLRRILREGMDEGAFRRMPLDVAVTLVESLLDVWTSELQRDLEAELGSFGEQIVEFLLQGIAPSPDAA
ncbi:TetR/AcrR family transcriptional regulator [Microbacterium sp. NPDC056044]|uniref:TetR/AcrR family transcriptional regulator n=1 Tax=Microbacterium sp. NPDC056044 TaxID=3345690 RepID=UPI0035DD1B64